MNKSKSNREFFKTTFVFTLFILSACGTSNVETSTATLPVPTNTKISILTKTPTSTSTVTPSPIAASAFDRFGLAPDQLAAMKAHPGLEASIAAEADGTFTASVSVLNQEGLPVVQVVEVLPATMVEDTTPKDKYSKTPVMQTSDGKFVYWIQEYSGWFMVERSPDIHSPVLIPAGKVEIPLRIETVANSAPFSQAALDRWLQKRGFSFTFQFLTDANNGKDVKFGTLQNRSMTEDDRNANNSPVQIIDSWYAMDMADGTRVQFFPTKWLDPTDPRNPSGDDWKIIFVASGPEIMGNEFNRNQYDNLLTLAQGDGSNIMVYPVVKASEGFFDTISSNGLITLFVNQPSMDKLLKISTGQLNNLSNPNLQGFKYDYWLNAAFDVINANNAGYGIYFENSNPDYKANFLNPDIQTIIFPSLIITGDT